MLNVNKNTNIKYRFFNALPLPGTYKILRRLEEFLQQIQNSEIFIFGKFLSSIHQVLSDKRVCDECLIKFKDRKYHRYSQKNWQRILSHDIWYQRIH